MDQTLDTIDSNVNQLLHLILPNAMQTVTGPLRPDSGSSFTLQHFNGDIQQQQSALLEATHKINDHVDTINTANNLFVEQLEAYRQDYYINNVKDTSHRFTDEDFSEKTQLERDILLLLRETQKCDTFIDTQRSRLHLIDEMLTQAHYDNQLYNASRVE